MNHPKQRQIRLPFSVPRPGLSEAPKRICGICRKNDSKYVCPRCNVAYCSLECFKSQSHVQCSEPFFKTTVMDSIAADPKADLEEKRKMMEMLKRFEDAQAGGEDALEELQKEDDDADDDVELSKALEGVDLDTIDTNQLFHLLPPAHRDAFIAALRDPDSADTRALVEDAADRGDGEDPGEEFPSLLPWWEASALEDGPESDDLPHAAPPEPVHAAVLHAVTPPAGVGRKTIFNAVAICIAYFHILLSFRLPSLASTSLEGVSVTSEELKREFGALLPFLLDQKSTIRYDSIRSAWESVWETIGRDADPAPSPDVLLRLLEFFPPLLQPSILSGRPPRVTVVLADLYHLFAKPKAGAAVPRKLAFYLVALKQLRREDWLELKAATEKEIERLRGETEVSEQIIEDERPALKV